MPSEENYNFYLPTTSFTKSYTPAKIIAHTPSSSSTSVSTYYNPITGKLVYLPIPKFNVDVEPEPMVKPKITTKYPDSDIPEYICPFIPANGKIYTTDSANKRILLETGSKEWFAELCRRRESRKNKKKIKQLCLALPSKK